MSCRVLKRGVEQCAMNRIFAHARERGFKRVRGRYLPTAKNVMVREFYAQFGFQLDRDDGPEGAVWGLPTETYQPIEVFIAERSAISPS